MTNDLKNINVSTIIGILMFLGTIGTGIFAAGKIMSTIEAQHKEVVEIKDESEKHIAELKKEILLLREANNDLEERTDDLEESRAYQEGKTGAERTQ